MAEGTQTAELPWLTKGFLEEVLRSSEDTDQLTVTEFTLEKASGSRDSPFCRRRHRVAVDFRVDRGPPKSLSLQVNTAPPNGLARELEDTGHLLEREALVYRMILPGMYEILRDVRGSPLTVREFPSFRTDAIVTEDVWGSPRGGRWSMDLPTCVLAVRALARFHATSTALLERMPELVPELREVVYTPENAGVILRVHGPGLEALAKATEGWPDYCHFAGKLRVLAKRVPELMARACAPGAEGRLKVLGHGRFEAGNLAFPQEGDVRLLDMRWCRVANPALDLHHFLATSAEDAVRGQYSSYLLEKYLKTFQATAGSLGCRAKLDEKQLDKQMNDTAFYALVAATTDLQLGRHSDGPSGMLFRKFMQKMLLRLEFNGVL